jgi:signal transduction histidine kinase
MSFPVSVNHAESRRAGEDNRVSAQLSHLIFEVERLGKPAIAVAAVSMVLLLGYCDYVITWQVSLSVFYEFPIAVAAWYLGRWPAFGLCLLAVTVWIAGDLADGFKPSSWVVEVWNFTIRACLYAALAQLFVYMRSFTATLEAAVNERTADLRREIAGRERLEREMLEVAERERRQFSYDLHDGLCQHLTGTALMAEVLREKLARGEVPCEAEAARVVELTEEGIGLARAVIKGLQPIDSHPGGLMQALQEFAPRASELFGVTCRYECDSPVLIGDPAVASHLYHIAREAVTNAARHGNARNVTISLVQGDEGICLTIDDDGIGLPDPLPSGSGLGLTSMTHRAKMIGARFAIRSGARDGTSVRCVLPDARAKPAAPRALSADVLNHV